MCPANNSTHCIDHFIVSGVLVNSITNSHNLHDGDNVSFHTTVSIQIGINLSYMSSIEHKVRSRPRWPCATQDILLEYGEAPDSVFSSIPRPFVLHCTNSVCNYDAAHCKLILLFHDSVTHNKSDGKRNTAVWNDLVKPYKEASTYWHHLWTHRGLLAVLPQPE